MADFQSLREEYTSNRLDGVDGNPLELFDAWLQEAIDEGVREPNAMALATVGADGPACRILLLKGRDARGLRFFTNYGSRKAADLESDPRAAATFWWPHLERQVRFEGTVSKLPESESDDYFARRPRETQLGAWSSQPQSGELPSRAALEDLHARLDAEYPEGTPIPRPPFWGGYVLEPERIEFWQGRAHRMHDRILCRRDGGQQRWTTARLAP